MRNGVPGTETVRHARCSPCHRQSGGNHPSTPGGDSEGAVSDMQFLPPQNQFQIAICVHTGPALLYETSAGCTIRVLTTSYVLGPLLIVHADRQVDLR